MPIKGLQTRAAVLGHVKIGGRKKIKTRNGEMIIPTKFDHFVVTTNEQGELGYIQDDVLARKLMEDQLNMLRSENTEEIWGFREMRDENGRVVRDENGVIVQERYLVKTIQHVSDKNLEDKNDKLRRILVALPFDDIDQNLVTSLSVYDREGCRCRGDGETAEWVDPRTGEVHKVTCPCNMLQFRLSDNDVVDERPDHEKVARGMKYDEKKGFQCKANGVLRLKIAQAKVLGGVHLFRTTSMNSIRQLMSAMQEVFDITGGFLAGVPLNLEVEPKRVSPGPNKKPQIVHVVNLTYKASVMEFLQNVINQTALREKMKKQLASREIAELPAPGYENPHDQVAIAQEFYSEESVPNSYIDAEASDRPNKKPPKQKEAPAKNTKPSTEDKKPAEKEEKSASQSEMFSSDKGQPSAPADKDVPGATKTPEDGDTKKQTSAGAQEAAHEPEKKSAPLEASKDSAPPEASEEPQEAKEASGDSEKPESSVSEQEADATDGANPQDAKEPEKSNGFPGVILDKPDGGSTKPAAKKLRKEFFLYARKQGFKDADIRSWIDELWEAKTSASLKTWQVEAMMDALQELKD